MTISISPTTELPPRAILFSPGPTSATRIYQDPDHWKEFLVPQDSFSAPLILDLAKLTDLRP